MSKFCLETLLRIGIKFNNSEELERVFKLHDSNFDFKLDVKGKNNNEL